MALVTKGGVKTLLCTLLAEPHDVVLGVRFQPSFGLVLLRAHDDGEIIDMWQDVDYMFHMAEPNVLNLASGPESGKYLYSCTTTRDEDPSICQLLGYATTPTGSQPVYVKREMKRHLKNALAACGRQYPQETTKKLLADWANACNQKNLHDTGQAIVDQCGDKERFCKAGDDKRRILPHWEVRVLVEKMTGRDFYDDIKQSKFPFVADYASTLKRK